MKGYCMWFWIKNHFDYQNLLPIYRQVPNILLYLKKIFTQLLLRRLTFLKCQNAKTLPYSSDKLASPKYNSDEAFYHLLP